MTLGLLGRVQRRGQASYLVRRVTHTALLTYLAGALALIAAASAGLTLQQLASPDASIQQAAMAFAAHQWQYASSATGADWGYLDTNSQDQARQRIESAQPPQTSPIDQPVTVSNLTAAVQGKDRDRAIALVTATVSLSDGRTIPAAAEVVLRHSGGTWLAAQVLPVLVDRTS